MLMAHGSQLPSAGYSHYVSGILHAEFLEDWMLDNLRGGGIRLVAVDRRKISGDNLAGYFFWPRSLNDALGGDLPVATVTKFDEAPEAQRLWDSGDIVLYDVSRVRHAPGDS